MSDIVSRPLDDEGRKTWDRIFGTPEEYQSQLQQIPIVEKPNEA